MQSMKKTFCFPYCRDGINFPFVVYRNLNGSHMTSFIQSQSVILVRGNKTLFCTNETLQYDLYIPVTFSGRTKACDIAHSYVTCGVGEQYDESTAMCV